MIELKCKQFKFQVYDTGPGGFSFNAGIFADWLIFNKICFYATFWRWCVQLQIDFPRDNIGDVF